MKKRLLAAVMAAAMTVTMAAGCGSPSTAGNDATTGAQGNSGAQNGAEATSAANAAEGTYVIGI